MNPFPVVLIAGRFTETGVRLSRFVIRGPDNASVLMLCKGRGCPRRSTKRNLGADGRIRMRSFQRRFRAGAVIKVFVRQEGRIGKYTRFKIRRGRAPSRRDRCLVPGSNKPVRCSSV